MSELATDGKQKRVLGMVHLRPLPGTPFYATDTFDETLAIAVQSARDLYDGGADGCLIQTVDRTYTVEDLSDPARTVALGVIVRAIVEATDGDFQVGVQLMRNATQAALAVAKVAGGDFIRCGAIVGMTLTPHGLVQANPHEVMDYRNKINAWDIQIIADIDTIHFKWFGEPKPTADVARYAKQVGADAVALGNPDEQKTLEMIRSVRRALPDLPIILAGHTNHENASRLLAEADGAFVGTCLKQDSRGGRIDVARVKSYVEIVRRLEH
jgi:uncharacterized protein